MKACDGGKNICFVCIGVLPDTVGFVPLMGRGTRCLISCIERTTGEAAQGQCTVQLPSGVIEKERQTIAALPTLKVLTLLKRTSRKRRKVKGENPGEDETASGSASTPKAAGGRSKMHRQMRSVPPMLSIQVPLLLRLQHPPYP